MLYERADQIDFELADAPALPRPVRVLMASPEHFEVAYVINPHMEGAVGTVNRSEARRQWDALREAYETLGVQPSVIEGAEGLPDLVFCANQTLPYYRDGRKGVLLSRMHAPERRPEVEHAARYFQRLGYETQPPPGPEGAAFEGMGDALWHPGRYLLWGGYGFRTERSVYEHIAAALGVRVLLLRLGDPDFYHLDTCFSALSPEAVLIYPGAFTAEGLALIRRLFPVVVEAPEDEARRLFACNAHCPDERHVLIQAGCAETCARLRAAGFMPQELQTSEFLKSGGSVFCMKLMFW